MSKTQPFGADRCPNCGEYGPHYVGPSLGDKGFFICKKKSDKMKIAYISGPYRAKTLRGVIDNIRKAEAVAIELWEMGYAVITPHLNTRLFPEEGQINYIKGDLEILDRLKPDHDFIVMLEGWDHSQGAGGELKKALSNGLKAYRWPRDRGVLSLSSSKMEQVDLT